MDETDLKKLLRGRNRRWLRRGWRCPNETRLAAYVNGQLDGGARQSLETHLADCDYCLGQVSFLAQAAEWTDLENVPPQLLARARNLVPRKSESTTTWGWRWAAPAAAVACLVLVAAFMVFYLRTRQTERASSGPLVAQQHEAETAPIQQTTPTLSVPPPAPTRSTQKPKSTEPAPATRQNGLRDLLPTVILPRDGAMLRRSELQFRWQPLADAEFYEIRVVTAQGDLVFESKTEDTHLGIGNEVQLQAGAKYFVSVRAHLRQGKTAKSNIVSFRIFE